ncbi:MAG TPA: hypothetical protein VIL74_00805 [Pyrinomonadaceae bacterium]|jgi:hypothetical protein
MEVGTEKSTEKSLEKVAAGKPVSVYSVNFTKVINKFSGKIFVVKPNSNGVAAPRNFSRRVFNWRNAAIAAAIMAIGVLHFAFQMSIVRNEVGENRPLYQVPPVGTEPLTAPPIESEPAPVEIKKIHAPLPPKSSARAVRERPIEPAPLKPRSKKKEAVDTRAARLRRAERILTGV